MTLMPAQNDMITSAFPLVAWQARSFPHIPAGITVDDLESEGHDALVEAAVTYDAACGVEFTTHAKKLVRSRMNDFIKVTRRQSGRRAPLEIEHDDGNTSPRVDVRAADPADRAASREMVKRKGQAGLCSEAPSPVAVANRAAELREAMFGAIEDRHAAEIVVAVMEKARKGDLKAARLFFDLIAPSRSGVVVHQQAIVIQQEDLE